MDINNMMHGITLSTYVDGAAREIYLSKVAAELVSGILMAGPAVPADLRTLANHYKYLMFGGRVSVPAAVKASMWDTLAKMIDKNLVPLDDIPFWDLDEDVDLDLEDDNLDEDKDMGKTSKGDAKGNKIRLADVNPTDLDVILRDYYIVCDNDGYLLTLLPHRK